MKDRNGFVTVTPETVEWRDSPMGGGARTSVQDGDPTKPGLYVQRIRYAPGMWTEPHFHPDDRHCLVLKGTWFVGTGEVRDLSKAQALAAGTYMKHPAGAAHWDGARDEEVIVQVIGFGPTGITRVAQKKT
jgi:quercetin dioxygenase-like cupin family protein